MIIDNSIFGDLTYNEGVETGLVYFKFKSEIPKKALKISFMITKKRISSL